jgi:hypothetical protein
MHSALHSSLPGAFAVCHAAPQEQQDAATATVETANLKMDPTAFQPGTQTLTFNPLQKKVFATRVIDTRVPATVIRTPQPGGTVVTLDSAGNVSRKQAT